MLRKYFLLLKSYLSIKFPDVNVGFYVSRRSNFIHMGVVVLLYSLKNYSDFVKEIHKFLSIDLDSSCFQLVEPQLALTVKWEYDYTVVKKIKKKRIMRNLSNTYVPKYISDNLK